ncbi:MAG TPA: PDZ domain-containing protein [bacterium]|nr:PDZ domain-containing protein [bacterium]
MSKLRKIFMGLLLFGQAALAAAAEPFGGVGVALDQDPQNPAGFVVTSVTYKSPADKAKIRRGDTLLKIDGADVAGQSLQQLAEKIRGPIGSTVTLTVSGGAGLRDVPLIRAQIAGGPVVSMPPPGGSTGPSPGGTAPSPGGGGVQFTPAEKEIVKGKIMGLKTDQQRETMMNLLQALKEGKITKEAFMKFLRTDFGDVNAPK